MAPATAPVLAAALLLLVAGVGKLRRPSYTVGALKSIGVRTRFRSVRALGLAEVATGLAAFVAGGPVPSALIGLSYLGFTGFLVLALRKGGAVSSCGCLGRPDTPPTRTHAALTTALGIAALVAAGAGGVDVRDLAWSATDMSLLAFTALVTWLVWLAFAVLPHVRLPRVSRLEGR
jgi:hypothetical protein